MLPWICSVTDHRGRQNVVADVLRGSSRVPAPRGAGTRDMESYLLNYRIFISIHFRTLQEERKGEGEKGKSVSPTPPFLFLPVPYPLWFPFGLRRECSGNMGKKLLIPFVPWCLDAFYRDAHYLNKPFHVFSAKFESDLWKTITRRYYSSKSWDFTDVGMVGGADFPPTIQTSVNYHNFGSRVISLFA